MRLYNYLNEDISDQELNKVVSRIQKECSSFLNVLENLRGSHLIYSGRQENDPFIIKQVRKQRKPKDTPFMIHQTLNLLFEKHFGVRLRDESIFVLTDDKEAAKYGNSYVIFPMGKYQLWSNPQVDDLYDQLNEIWIRVKEKHEDSLGNPARLMTLSGFLKAHSLESGVGKEVWDDLKEEMENVVKNYQRGFPTKRSRKEWMLHCDSYIGVKGGVVATKVLKKLGIEDSVNL